jgi:hypothetical protein
MDSKEITDIQIKIECIHKAAMYLNTLCGDLPIYIQVSADKKNFTEEEFLVIYSSKNTDEK